MSIEPCSLGDLVGSAGAKASASNWGRGRSLRVQYAGDCSNQGAARQDPVNLLGQVVGRRLTPASTRCSDSASLTVTPNFELSEFPRTIGLTYSRVSVA